MDATFMPTASRKEALPILAAVFSNIPKSRLIFTRYGKKRVLTLSTPTLCQSRTQAEWCESRGSPSSWEKNNQTRSGPKYGCVQGTGNLPQSQRGKEKCTSTRGVKGIQARERGQPLKRAATSFWVFSIDRLAHASNRLLGYKWSLYLCYYTSVYSRQPNPRWSNQ